MSETSATLKINDFSSNPLLDVAADHLRAGRLAEARSELDQVIARSSGASRLEAVLLLAKVELAARDYDRQLALLDEYRPHFDAVADHGLFAWFFMMRGTARQGLAERTGSAEQAGFAFMDYEQAAHHRLQSHSWVGAGEALNNMALMLHRAGHRAEARDHLTRARACFTDLPAKLAQVDATEAEMFKDEGNAREARRLSSRAVAVFAEHGMDRLLTSLLPVHLWALATCENAERGEG